MSKQELKQKGFTIIEVVLVLAIAALIFLMVFIALPALQRSQRDTQRKDDLARVQTAITNYQGNNRNGLPDNWGTFTKNYLQAGGDSFTDPSGKDYAFVEDADPGSTPNTRDMTDNDQDAVRIFYATGYTCNGESLTGGQGARKIALRMVLEGGGVSCINN
jgi:prepilin-type N-terminal cleavage/methylation domain-containing protein